MIQASKAYPLTPAKVINLQGCDMLVPQRRVPQGDTFYCIGGSKEALINVISEDITRNRTHRRLAYYLNGAQQADVVAILQGITHHQSQLRNWHVSLTFSNLLYSSLGIAWEITGIHMGHLKPDFEIDMEAVFMDNEDTAQLNRFCVMQKPFTGVMCNMGGAKLTDTRPLAAMLWGMTQAGGWVQSDLTDLLEYFIDKAKLEGGKHQGIAFQRDDDAYPTGIHTTDNIKDGFHWIRKEE